MPYPRAFRHGPIEPVVEVGQNLLVVEREAYSLFSVAYVEAIPRSGPLLMDLGALGAGATTVPTSTQNILDMQDGQLGHFRAVVLDDINVQMLQPQAVSRMGTKNINSRLTAFNALYDECDHLSEFYIYEDERMYVAVTNPWAFAITQSRIAFYGFRYVLAGPKGPAASGHVEPIARFNSIMDATKSGQHFTVVPAGGWGR